MVSKFTSRGQSSDTQPLPMWVGSMENEKEGAEFAPSEVTFGRNVLICSNLSYCNCFEYIRSFIAKVKLPSASINWVLTAFCAAHRCACVTLLGAP